MLLILCFVSTALVGLVNADCLDNGDKLIQGRCYKFVPVQLTFNDARDWCHSRNPVAASYLAYVPNTYTNNFLASYARVEFGTNVGDFWLGLSRNSSSSRWIWDNDIRLGWSNFGTELGQNYIAESVVTGKWNAFREDATKYFVCDYDPAAPPTFPTQPPASSTPTTATPDETTTEEYDDFCNIGEKHSTFLFAYSTEFSVTTFQQMKRVVVQAISANRHNYTKLAMARFDSSGGPQNITYFDDVQSFSDALDSNPPNPNNTANSSMPSDVLSIISSFLAATGRPLESSMVVLLIKRFPAANADLTSSEYDTITNANVKIFPIISDTMYSHQIPTGIQNSKVLTTISANSNAHFAIGGYGQPLVQVFQHLMSTAYLDSLAVTRSFIDNNGSLQQQIGRLRVPHSETASLVNFTITISALVPYSPSTKYTNTNGIELTFYQSETSQKTVKFEPGSSTDTNFYYGTVQLKESATYEVLYQSSLDHGTITNVRVWTESALYHYGSYASLEDPVGGVTLDRVDEYQGAALRMKLMNDCYTNHAGYAVFTDCSGAVSAKYDSSQTIPIDYIFADEGSFPHYPIVPFFCDSAPKNAFNCVSGTESKYDIQFVSGEFTVIRSFQCRPGVGQINPNCTNIDANGNYYCNRDQLPYMRGPTGQIPDCLGHGHVEYDFISAEAYICVCDNGYSGVSCEKKL